MVGTPCYVMSEHHVRAALGSLNTLGLGIPLRHWLSLKTQPVARLVHVANQLGLGIDVVSEYELAAVLADGTPGNRILVNGVGKHHWLPRRCIRDLTVHFDSLNEVRALATNARRSNWRVGLRCAIRAPAGGSYSIEEDQFGMSEEEVRVASAALSDEGVGVSGLHFHLHTNVQHVAEYAQALRIVADIAESAQIEPEYIDIGGGLPIPGEASLDGFATAGLFNLSEFRDLLVSIPTTVRSVREVWLENGRFLTGLAGALVLTVLDKKEREGCTYLICDGGRVNHARMASVEEHEILLAPERIGPLRKTVVCGPTCTAVDRLGSWLLPESVKPGDRVIWLTAGAYHIPLETRFSTGLAPVVWFNDHQEPEIIRNRETPAEWWSQWIAPDRARHA